MSEQTEKHGELKGCQALRIHSRPRLNHPLEIPKAPRWEPFGYRMDGHEGLVGYCGDPFLCPACVTARDDRIAELENAVNTFVCANGVRVRQELCDPGLLYFVERWVDSGPVAMFRIVGRGNTSVEAILAAHSSETLLGDGADDPQMPSSPDAGQHFETAEYEKVDSNPDLDTPGSGEDMRG